jgi:hypothetical protein
VRELRVLRARRDLRLQGADIVPELPGMRDSLLDRLGFGQLPRAFMAVRGVNVANMPGRRIVERHNHSAHDSRRVAGGDDEVRFQGSS